MILVRRLVVLAMLTIALTLAVACGEDSAESEPQTSEPTTVSATPQPITQDESLRAGLLTLSDLGEGWEDIPLDDATSATTILCGEPIELEGPRLIAAWSHDESGVSLFNSVTEASVDAAQRHLDGIHELTEDCDAAVATDGVASTAYHIQSAELGEFGDDSIAWLTLPDGSESRGYDITIRRGPYVATVGLFWPGEPDAAAAAKIAAAADARLQELVEDRSAP